MRLDSVFPKRVVTATAETHLCAIADMMDEEGVGTVVVVDEQERPIGIVTDRDMAIELGSGRVIRSEAARVIMSRPLATIGCHEGILAATRRMCDNAVRRLPIVDDNGKLVGLISEDDLLMLLGREIGNLVGCVRQEIGTAKFSRG